jgi:ATP-dependent exoDNAse (exonuclease V) beta subunit
MLASIDLAADIDAIRASAVINGRLVGATEEESVAAVAAVHNTLEHPILRRAAASAMKGEIRRETPVLFKLDDGGLVEGVVDLAFREDTTEFVGWTVVDFKTDREFVVASDRYSAQVSVYSAAIQVATGLLTRGFLLVV